MPPRPRTRQLREGDVLAAVYELLRLVIEHESAAMLAQLPDLDREHLTHIYEHTSGNKMLADAVGVLLRRKKKREGESRRYRLARVAAELADEAFELRRKPKHVATAELVAWMSERLFGVFPRAVLNSSKFRDILEGEARYVLYGPKKQAAEDSHERKGKRHFTGDEGWKHRAQQAMHHLDEQLAIGRSTLGTLQKDLEKSARARAVEGDDAGWGAEMVRVVERALKHVAEATYDVPYETQTDVALDAWRLRPKT